MSTRRRGLPVRLERDHVLECRAEIPAEAHRAIVDEYVRGRLAVRNRGHMGQQAVFAEPPAHAGRVARREHDDVEPARFERFQELPGARPRGIPMIRTTPARVAVQHAVEVDAHQRLRRIVELCPAESPRHILQSSILRPMPPPGVDARRVRSLR